jgi:ubiquinone/menaquinone biosynthesis C-methylase UbiE
MEADAADVAREDYDQWHAQFDLDDGADSPWHELVKAHLDPRRDLDGRRVLEIGCGRGGFSAWIARSSSPAEQVAMDFSEVAVRKGRAAAANAGLSRITWEMGDIQNIPRADASFDTVISCETIEHVPDPARAVRELARVLRPGGRLFLTTPSYLNTMGLYRVYLRMRGRRFSEVGQPINQFTTLPRTLRWVSRAGLRVLAVDAVGHYLPFPGRPAIRVAPLDGARVLTRWVGHHSFVASSKP